MRISDWSSDVCSSDLGIEARVDGGSFDTVRGKLAVGFASGRGDAFIALTGDTSDGGRDHARRDSLRLNANAGLRLTDSLETRFYASVQDRSNARRVGKECVSTCRSRWSRGRKK